MGLWNTLEFACVTAEMVAVSAYDVAAGPSSTAYQSRCYWCEYHGVASTKNAAFAKAAYHIMLAHGRTPETIPPVEKESAVHFLEPRQVELK